MKRNILFLCTGNSARSQMAEAFLKKHAGGTFDVHSAGTEPADELFSPAVKAMAEAGIDISQNKPKGIEQFLGYKHFEKVFIVCDGAAKKCPVIFGRAERILWPFDDPARAIGTEEEIRDSCRKIRDQIEAKILEWLKHETI